MSLEVLKLPTTRKSYIFDDATLERLNKLGSRFPGKTESEIVRDSLTHMLGTAERDQPFWLTVPSEVQKSKAPDHNSGPSRRS